MLQWRNWHTRQIQTLFSPGSTPGWSTIFEINSGGDFVNNISAVAIGMLIAAHREGDEEKFRAYVELIAETYEQQGNDHAANIIRSYYTGDYGEQGKVILDETKGDNRRCCARLLMLCRLLSIVMNLNSSPTNPALFPIPIDRQKQTSDGCGASSDGICIPNAACRFISAGGVFLLPAIQKGSKRK